MPGTAFQGATEVDEREAEEFTSARAKLSVHFDQITANYPIKRPRPLRKVTAASARVEEKLDACCSDSADRERRPHVQDDDYNADNDGIRLG